MPLGLNGNGTVTGLSVGGLPDGSVAQADLAGGVAGNGPAFSAYQSSSQTISNATTTKVLFQTKEFDTASCYDTTTSRFTPNVAGYYLISGSYAVNSGSQGTNTWLTIYKNGSAAKRYSQGALWTAQGSALVYANGTTDYFELYVNQSSGANQTGYATVDGTYFQGALVRAA